MPIPSGRGKGKLGAILMLVWWLLLGYLVTASYTFITERLENALPQNLMGEIFEMMILGAVAPFYCIIVIVGLLLPALAYAIIKAFTSPRGPYEYRRVCQLCGRRWTWWPGKLQLRVYVRHKLLQGKTPSPTRQKVVQSAVVAGPVAKRWRATLQRRRVQTYRRFLDELRACWEGTLAPEPDFLLKTPVQAEAFFRAYQRALGGVTELEVGHEITGYMRNYRPQPQEILEFVEAYGHLHRGEVEDAAHALHKLTESTPQFAEPWIWLSATTDDPAERLAYLEEAVRLEPAHPLAVDGLAVARDKTSPEGTGPAQGRDIHVVIAKCPQCGGSLHYEPGEDVICAHCGHRIRLPTVNLIGDVDAPRVSSLRLQRVYEGRAWKEAGQIVRCRTCGAELTLTQHLAHRCAYCGSANVLIADSERVLQQPDGFLPVQVSRKRASEVARAKTSSRTKLHTIHGIYVPFWVFDGDVVLQSIRKKDGGLTEAIPGRILHYENLLFPGTDVPPISALDQVPPFELDTVASYEPQLWGDWPAQLYNLDVELVVEDTYDVMLARARDEAVGALSSLSPKATHYGFQVSNVTYRLVLLPVWAVLLESKNERSLVLVNGQTGKVAIGLTLVGDSKEGAR